MNRYFNHIFVVSRCKNKERRTHIDEQMKYFGISNYSYWYVPDYDFDNSNIFKENNKILLPQKRCAFGHYSLWKACYDLEYYNVLILEDDACFIKNKDDYNAILEDFDKQWRNQTDIFLFDYYKLFTMKGISSYTLGTCYWLNKTGLEYLIRSHEKYNIVNDFYFNDVREYCKDNPGIDYLTFFYTIHLTDDCNGVHMEYFENDLSIRINTSENHLVVQPDKVAHDIYFKNLYFNY